MKLTAIDLLRDPYVLKKIIRDHDTSQTIARKLIAGFSNSIADVTVMNHPALNRQ